LTIKFARHIADVCPLRAMQISCRQPAHRTLSYCDVTYTSRHLALIKLTITRLVDFAQSIQLSNIVLISLR
jgi:hypothetical protein